MRDGLPALYFYSPEDVIIGILSSPRQWRDVASILKSSPVDSEQLLGSARDQNLEDWFSRAMRDAGLIPGE